MRALFLLILAYFGGFSSVAAAATSPTPTDRLIEVDVSKSYELANIVLALTPYGRSDDWEVLKETPYYRDVMEFFDPCRDHPLLKEVNYSRDRWEEYLAFRSDAYAFSYGADVTLDRVSALRTSNTFSPFDDQLPLVRDFAKNCHFDAFYDAHLTYYSKLAEAYRNAYMFPQMLAFLKREFGDSESSGRYIIALSPLVGRMNAQRHVGDDQVSFVTPARGLVDDSGSSLSVHDRIVEIHTLFTELDHAFINPVSDSYRPRLDAAFDWKAWGPESGYKSNFETFNEYMTWAAYDVFVSEQFGESANSAIVNWHLQNKSRGFVASELFAEKLLALRRDGVETIRDSYPAILDWAQNVRSTLEVPRLIGTKIKQRNGLYQVRMTFSTAMHTDNEIVVKSILHDGSAKRKSGPSITLSENANRLRWLRSGKALAFELPMDAGRLAGLTFNWWDCTALQGEHGVYLEPATKLLFDSASSQ